MGKKRMSMLLNLNLYNRMKKAILMLIQIQMIWKKVCWLIYACYLIINLSLCFLCIEGLMSEPFSQHFEVDIEDHVITKLACRPAIKAIKVRCFWALKDDMVILFNVVWLLFLDRNWQWNCVALSIYFWINYWKSCMYWV